MEVGACRLQHTQLIRRAQLENDLDELREAQ